MMRKELEVILLGIAPEFYRESVSPPEKSCMCFGFECGDGWFEPLLDFSRKVEPLNELAIKSHFSFVASQVKEICAALEERCWNTCEKCGATEGIITTGEWMQRLCKNCAEARNGKPQADGRERKSQ